MGVRGEVGALAVVCGAALPSTLHPKNICEGFFALSCVLWPAHIRSARDVDLFFLLEGLNTEFTTVRPRKGRPEGSGGGR